MQDLSEAVTAALQLIGSLNPDLLEIVALSLQVSLTAVAIAGLIGLPLGAVVASDDLMADFVGGGTFSGNSISCAAALANINIIQKENLIKNAETMGQYMINELLSMSKRHDLIGEVRGKGLLVGVELVKDRKKKKPAVKATKQFIKKAEQKGDRGDFGSSLALLAVRWPGDANGRNMHVYLF